MIKKPVSSLFQKDLCSVFIFHLEKKKSGCPSPNMDVRAGKRKGEYTFFYLSRQHKVCLQIWNETGPLASHFPLYNLFIFIYFHLYTKEDWKRQVRGCRHKGQYFCNQLL